MPNEQHEEDRSPDNSQTEVPVCGVIRPIAELQDYPAAHWLEVHAIIADAAEQAGHRARLVSESDASGVILSEIVSNLYNDPIVICDVSGRNPNVMFELGMRLAFEKPTIVIKDDETPFSFDTSPVKHLVYPRTLRFQLIVDFKADLAKAISATIAYSAKPEHRGYLQQFGPISVTQLGEQQVTLNTLAEELRTTRRMLRSIGDSKYGSGPYAAQEASSLQILRFEITGDHGMLQDVKVQERFSQLVSFYEGVSTVSFFPRKNSGLILELKYTGPRYSTDTVIRGVTNMLLSEPSVVSVGGPSIRQA